jgi:hypothetical protein
MRLFIALALAAAPSEAAPPPATDDVLPVLRAMLDFEAAHAEPGRTTCVSDKTSPPFEFTTFEVGLAAASAAPPQPSEYDPSPSPGPGFSWLAPPAMGEDWTDPNPLDSVASARFNALLDQAMQAERGPTSVRIPSALIPPPLKRRTPRRTCRHRLGLATPVLVGDVAFVETHSSCGSLCGGGSLYALTRREGRWTVTAYIGLYVS